MFTAGTRRIFFTSDLHLGHANVIKYSRRDSFLTDTDKRALEDRGGKWNDDGLTPNYYRISQESVYLMNDILISNINKLVGEDDELWFLGDFCFSPNKYSYYPTAKKYRDRIKCKNMHIVFGNHDHRSIRD